MFGWKNKMMLGNKCSTGVSADYFQSILIDNPPAPVTDIQIGPPRYGLHLIALLITGIKPLSVGCIFTYANPRFIVPYFVSNALVSIVHRHQCFILTDST